MPAKNTHPRYAWITDWRKSWATRHIPSPRYSKRIVTNYIKQHPHYHESSWWITKYDIAPTSATQRTGDRVFSLRKILWPSHRRNCCRLSQPDSIARWDSTRTPNQKKRFHWWRSERSLHFYPPGVSQAAACDGLLYSANNNGHKQMRVVLNWLAVLYLNLIGQIKYSCQNFDQATVLLECGQNWSQGPNFDHFAQSEWSLLNKRRNTAKWSQKG